MRRPTLTLGCFDLVVGYAVTGIAKVRSLP